MSSRLFKKKKRSHASGDDFSLNITSLADVMVIILVFMLKSFSAGAISVTPAPGIELPVADVKGPEYDALKIEISQDAVLVADKPAVVLANFVVNKQEILTNGSVRSLGDILQKERQRQMLIAKANSDVKIDPKVIIVADQRAPYATIKAVLASAAVHGYTDFKLAVVQPN
ncbi:MAG: ExbD/TolR family protein [Bacteriovoracia bacterium]